ncbi:hypothetical protein, partial [Staphylococcus aureus]
MSRGLGDVYKRQTWLAATLNSLTAQSKNPNTLVTTCLLYTSDAADDSLRVDLGGRRIIKKTLMIKLKEISQTHNS